MDFRSGIHCSLYMYHDLTHTSAGSKYILVDGVVMQQHGRAANTNLESEGPLPENHLGSGGDAVAAAAVVHSTSLRPLSPSSWLLERVLYLRQIKQFKKWLYSLESHQITDIFEFLSELGGRGQKKPYQGNISKATTTISTLEK